MKNKLIILAFLLIPALVQAQVDLGQPSDSVETELSYGAPKEYEIAEITVSGAQFLDPNALISITGLKVGDKIRIPGDDISSGIKKLWEQGILGDVKISATKIEGDKIYLDIFTKERPRLSKFTFKGIRKGEIDALTDKIKLIRGKVIDDALIKNTQKTVKKYFVDKGFLNTSVNIVQVSDSLRGNTATLKINVDKNSKVKINQIVINGNEEFSDKKLRKKLKKTKQKGGLFSIFTPSKFIASEYEADKQKLITYLNSQGYRDAIIVSDSIYKHDDKTINIQINLEEGQKYYFRNITWEGNYVYTDEQLDAILGVKKGDVYNLEDLDKRIHYNPNGMDVSSLYMDDGYLFFQIEPVEVAVEGDSIDLEMRIVEGQQATINKVLISGNTRTSDHVVLREIRTLPGQKFSRTQLIRTQREIATLGYFDPEKVNPVPIPNPADGTVDIEYQLEERPSDQIELSGGWGGGGRRSPYGVGFVGTLGVVFNNFSTRKLFKWKEWGGILPTGDGQKLAIRFQASGRQFQTYSLTFTEPWLGGRKPNSLSVNLSHTVNTIPAGLDRLYGGSGGGQDRSFQISSASVSLGRRLKVPDDYFTLSNSLSYLIYQMNNYYSSGALPSDGNFHNFTFNTTLARNSIDNPTFPRRGSSVSLSLSLTPPYSVFDRTPLSNNEPSQKNNVEYHKWMFDSNWFTTLTGKLVLSARAHMGFIGRYSSDEPYSPFERFVVGGSGMTQGNFLMGMDIIGLRGYEEQRIGPWNAQTGRPQGGVIYNKFVLELRYPIMMNPSSTIYAVSFLEGGNNWGDFSEYNPFKLYRSAGVGARILMPAFGLIGIDYGWGFDKIPGQPGPQFGRKPFTISIGQQFR